MGRRTMGIRDEVSDNSLNRKTTVTINRRSKRSEETIMIKQGTYILHADEASSITAKVTTDFITITDSIWDGDTKEYQVPTYYMEKLMEEM